jgi:predicted DNA-binding transcriptional regulator AlpA
MKPNAPPQKATPTTLRPRDLWSLLNMSKSGFYRAVALGLIPEGVKIMGGKRWLEADVLAWIEGGAPPAAEWAKRKAAGRKGGA